MSLTSIISASTWPNVKSKDSFEILKQISKLTLLFKFGQVKAEILPKNKLPSFFVDKVYYLKQYKFRESHDANASHPVGGPKSKYTLKLIKVFG